MSAVTKDIEQLNQVLPKFTRKAVNERQVPVKGLRR